MKATQRPSTRVNPNTNGGMAPVQTRRRPTIATTGPMALPAAHGPAPSPAASLSLGTIVRRVAVMSAFVALLVGAVTATYALLWPDQLGAELHLIAEPAGVALVANAIFDLVSGPALSQRTLRRVSTSAIVLGAVVAIAGALVPGPVSHLAEFVGAVGGISGLISAAVSDPVSAPQAQSPRGLMGI